MAPPRHPDPAPDAGAVAGYDALCEEIAQTQGIINLAEARLVELTRQGLAMGVSGGDNLEPKEWLAWRAGISPERAASIVRVAERAHELPDTLAALGAGELTVDQAAVVARHVAVRYEASAARVARSCTVAQLRLSLPHYRDRKPRAPRPPQESHGRVVSRFDETGYHLHLHLPDVAKGAVVDQALKAMHEDLRRQARDHAPDGCAPEPVYATDALVALAETALRAGEAARPGTDRYLVHVHLEAGPAGVELMTHLGVPIPDGERRHILCDARLRGLLHDGLAPLASGRTTRHINRRLRRAIEHRDHGCCTVPGCRRTSGLEIHHIIHWEDGGPTDPSNLITLCRYHHHRHHQGTLGIDGNANQPRHTAPGVVFTNHLGHRLDPVGHPILPTPPPPGTGPARHLTNTAKAAGIGTHRYLPPTGERLDRWGFHLMETPPPPDTDDHPADTDPPPDPTPEPGRDTPNPTGPAGDIPIDPTRAGPTA